MTFCGDRSFVPSGINHHPFPEPSPQGASLPRPETTVRVQQKFLPAFGQKLLWDVHFTPGLAETVVAVFAPGDRGLHWCTAPDRTTAGTRRNDEERVRETALPLTSRRPFAGMRGAQATARQRRRYCSGRCKPGVFTHRTVATARNRASGFGGDGRCASSCLSESGLTTGCRQAAGAEGRPRQTGQHCSSQNQRGRKRE